MLFIRSRGALLRGPRNPASVVIAPSQAPVVGQPYAQPGGSKSDFAAVQFFAPKSASSHSFRQNAAACVRCGPRAAAVAAVCRGARAVYADRAAAVRVRAAAAGVRRRAATGAGAVQRHAAGVRAQWRVVE
jgi:hypothetical protein